MGIGAAGPQRRLCTKKTFAHTTRSCTVSSERRKEIQVARRQGIDPEDLPVLVELIYRHLVLKEKLSHIVWPAEKARKRAKEMGLPPVPSDTLRISRSKAHGLLRYAEKKHFFETIVHVQPDPQEELGLLVQRACREHGVRNVVVFPGIPDDRDGKLDRFEYRAFLRRSLGAFAARYVERLSLRQGDHVAIGGGRTMASFAQHFSPSERDLVFRPLATGGRWRTIGSADAAAVVQALVTRLGAEAGGGALALCPELPPGAPADLRRRPEVRAVFTEEGIPPRVALTGLGWAHYVPSDDPQGLGPHEDTSSFVQMVAHAELYASRGRALAKRHRLTKKDLALFYGPLPDSVYNRAAKRLAKAGIIGDICRHGITAAGEVKPTALDEASLTVSPHLLKLWREAGETETIVVAAGSWAAPVVRAALALQCFGTLVIDAALAVQLIPPDNRPAAYKGIPTVSDPSE